MLGCMADLIITGASRGIGRALALEMAARGERLVLVARDAARLRELVREIVGRGGKAIAVDGDLSTLTGARALGDRLAGLADRGSTLVHNAGIWPSRRERTVDGWEMAFAVNHLGPLAMQHRRLGEVVRNLQSAYEDVQLAEGFGAHRGPGARGVLVLGELPVPQGRIEERTRFDAVGVARSELVVSGHHAPNPRTATRAAPRRRGRG